MLYLTLITVPDTDKKLVKNIVESIDNVTVIDFYTQDLEKLSIIAKHRVLPVTSALIFDDGKCVGRIVGEALAPKSLKSAVELLSR